MTTGFADRRKRYHRAQKYVNYPTTIKRRTPQISSLHVADMKHDVYSNLKYVNCDRLHICLHTAVLPEVDGTQTILDDQMSPASNMSL